MYIIYMDKFNISDPVILDQIASYDQVEIDELCLSLSKELNAQKKLNNILKDNNFDTNMKTINNFIARNSKMIDYHHEELDKIIKELKNIVNENTELKNEYNELIESEECKNISNKLKEIKKMKKNITDFLQKSGI